MFKSIWSKIKEIFSNMLPSKTIETALHIKPSISNEMLEAIELWDNIYKDKADWLHEPTYSNPTRIVSLGLGSFIASEKARLAVLELKSDISAPTEEIEEDNPDYIPPGIDNFGNPTLGRGSQKIKVKKDLSDPQRADFLDQVYQDKVMPKVRPFLEYGIAKGGFVMKPYIILDRKYDEVTGKVEETPDIEVDFVQAEEFYPLSFDGSGNITEAAFIQTKIDKDFTYRRLEHHVLYGNSVTVKNRAFKTDNNQSNLSSSFELGKEISLKEVPEWSELKPEQTINNVDRLLFAYFKMPDANTIDTSSPLGVSGYSRAVSLIKDADIQYSRMLWEFEATEAAIDIDRDALNEEGDVYGTSHTYYPMFQQRMFRKVTLGDDNTYYPYNPPIRDESIINGLNTILMRIEDVCALSRGTISDASNQARTATELKLLKQRTYEANVHVQKALEDALRDVVYVMNVYATLYDMVPDGEYEASFEWDDSVLVDVNEEMNKRMTLLNENIISPVEMRMWYFGETEAQAVEALQKVRDYNMIIAQDTITEEIMMGRAINQNNVDNEDDWNDKEEDHFKNKQDKKKETKEIVKKGETKLDA